MTQLVLQHNFWEPQHVRRQAQDGDVPKVFGIPLQPAVYPDLEAWVCQQWALLLFRLPHAPSSLAEDWTGPRNCNQGGLGDAHTEWGLRTVTYICAGCTLHN